MNALYSVRRLAFMVVITAAMTLTLSIAFGVSGQDGDGGDLPPVSDPANDISTTGALNFSRQPVARAACPQTNDEGGCVFNVNSNQDTTDDRPGDGVCADIQGNCSLRAAVMEANKTDVFDTVNLPSDNYELDKNDPTGPGYDPDEVVDLNEGSDLDILASIEIIGGGAETTIIDGLFLWERPIDVGPRIVAPINVEISGVTIKGGNEDNKDGGVTVVGAHTLTLSEVVVTDNEGRGLFAIGATVYVNNSRIEGNRTGAVFNESGYVEINDSVIIRNTGESAVTNDPGTPDPYTVINRSTIRENDAGTTSSAHRGGGVENLDGVVEIIDSYIVLNRAYNGGGIYTDSTGGAATADNVGTIIRNSAIANNYAQQWGGGIYVHDDGLRVVNSTISGNRAIDQGGGIYNREVTELLNVTISGNRAENNGGGIFYYGDNSNDSMSLHSVTVAENEARRGGGLNIDLSRQDGAILVGNSVFARNFARIQGDDCFTEGAPGVVLSQGHNLVSNSNGCADFTELTDLNDVAAQIGSLEPNGGLTCTHALVNDGTNISPAIDAGYGTLDSDTVVTFGECATSDQRGGSRVSTCDIGSYEFGSTNVTANNVPCVFSPPPDAVDDNYETGFETVLTVDGGTEFPSILANDIDVAGTGNIDVAPDFVTTLTTTQGGTADLAVDGTFVYTPPTGFDGTDRFDYEIFDGLTQSAPATVFIDVKQPPQAQNDSYTTPFETQLTVAAPGVLNNDQSLSGAALEANADSGTTSNNGTWALQTDGSFTYTPAPSFTGTDTFSYSVTDGFTPTSNRATVTITINAQNAVTAVDDQYNTPFNQTLSQNAPGVLGNDRPQNLVLRALPSNGSTANGDWEVFADGSFTYTPRSEFTGTDSFNYTVEDSNDPNNSDQGRVTINVGQAGAVQASDDAYSTDAGSPLTIAAPGVLDNDNTQSGTLQAVEVTGGTTSNGGVYNLQVNGALSYTPASGYNGVDSFTYTATNGSNTDTATISITVGNVNTTLQANNDTYTTSVDTSLSEVAPGVLGNDTTQSGTLQAVTANSATTDQGGSYSLQSSGAFNYTPPTGYTGIDSFTYTANNGTDTDTATVTINIGQVDTSAPSLLTVNGSLTTAPVLPNFTWRGVQGATWYNLYAINTTGSSGANEWVSANEICDSSLNCAFTPTAGLEYTGMLNGDFSWWVTAYVQATNTTPYTQGDDFTVNIPASQLNSSNVTLDPNQGHPVISWPDDGATLWVQVWVGSSPWGDSLEWYGRDYEFGPSFTCENGTCSLVALFNAPTGGTYLSWMQAWGPGGFSSGGPVPSAPSWFEVSDGFSMPSSAPSAPQSPQVTNTSGGMPNFEWTAPANATWYNVAIAPADNSWSADLGWYAGSMLDCTNAGELCVLEYPWSPTALPNGTYTAYFSAWGPAATDIVTETATFTLP